MLLIKLIIKGVCALFFGLESSFGTGRHIVFNLHAHLVFVTKYRRKVLNQKILDDMKNI
jgi:hypothetical protein